MDKNENGSNDFENNMKESGKTANRKIIIVALSVIIAAGILVGGFFLGKNSNKASDDVEADISQSTEDFSEALPENDITDEDVSENSITSDKNKTSEKETSSTAKKTTEKTKTEKKTELAEWKKAYKKILLEKCNDPDNTMSAFSLINIDSDNIPELLIYKGGSHFDTTLAYSYSNGRLVECGEHGSFGGVLYADNKIVGTFTAGTGGTMHYVSVAEIRNGKYKLIWEGKRDNADGMPIEFYSGNANISEEEFADLFDKYVPDTLYTAGYGMGDDYISVFEEYGCKTVQVFSSPEEKYEMNKSSIEKVLK